jgi:hypothetical protein
MSSTPGLFASLARLVLDRGTTRPIRRRSALQKSRRHGIVPFNPPTTPLANLVEAVAVAVNGTVRVTRRTTSPTAVSLRPCTVNSSHQLDVHHTESHIFSHNMRLNTYIFYNFTLRIHFLSTSAHEVRTSHMIQASTRLMDYYFDFWHIDVMESLRGPAPPNAFRTPHG